MKTILPLQTENYFSLNPPKQCPPKESFNPLSVAQKLLPSLVTSHVIPRVYENSLTER